MYGKNNDWDNKKTDYVMHLELQLALKIVQYLNAKR